MHDCKEQILSEDYMDFIITEKRMGRFTDQLKEDLCIQNLGVMYECLYVQSITEDTFSAKGFAYSMIPHCYTLMDTEAINQAGITSIQNYPTLQLYGSNVMIGFIDTGIAYQNDIFRMLDGSTRIEAIWDQTIQTGTPPKDFLYGSEYTREMIDHALRQEDPLQVVPSVDENGHGTYIASLAAGSANIENQFLGAAPEAHIAMVKVKPAKKYLKDYHVINSEAPCYQENDLMSALRYLHELAEDHEIPLVICLAMGTNMGSHSGSTPLAGLLETYANFSNRAIIIGGGNEADQGHHFSDKITTVGAQSPVEISVGKNTKGFTLELWTKIPNVMAVSVKSPAGETIPVSSVRDRGSIEYNFIFDRTKIMIDYRLMVEKTSSESVFMRFFGVGEGIWTIFVHAENVADGEFHMWLPADGFTEGKVNFVRPNPDITLTEPASAFSPVAVGFYDSRNNSVTNRSGRGYTRNNAIKPDLAAPGVAVIGGAPGNKFTTKTGSSVAAAITTGAAALLMEWSVYISGQKDVDSQQIKNYLILGAEQDGTNTYPNRTWGYGRLDLYNTFLRLSEY